MSVVAAPRTITVRSLRAERQLVSCEGVTRTIVRIPDYQVKLEPGGPWHRRGAIESETACGLPNNNETALRAYLLDGELCDVGCFSPHEVKLGKAHALAIDTARFDFSDADD